MSQATAHKFHREGNTRYRRGDFEGAILLYSRAIEEDSELLESYFNRALAYIRIKKYSDALSDLEACQQLDPELAEVNYVIGIVHQYREAYVEALREMLVAVVKDPDYHKAIRQIVHVLESLGTTEPAPEGLEELLERMSRMEQAEIAINAYILRSLLATNRYDYAFAEEYLEAALELFPDEPTILTNLAKIDMRIGDYTTAEQRLHRILQIEPGHGRTLMSLGEMYMERSQFDDAEKCYRALLREDPTHSGAYEGLGHLARSLGDSSRAQAYYRLALSYESDRPGAMYELACLVRHENPELAWCLLTRLVNMEPDFPDAQEELSQLRLILDTENGIDCEDLLPHPDPALTTLFSWMEEMDSRGQVSLWDIDPQDDDDSRDDGSLF